MSSKLQFGILGAVMIALVASAPAEASAQAGGRYRVMVTNLVPQDAKDNFGKDLAKELRKLINELPTHMPVEEKEIKNAAKRFDIDMKELDCIRSLQLATQIDSELVMCGTYTDDRDAKTVSLAGLQFAAPGGASFAIEDKTWGEKEYKEAAQEIFLSFEAYVQQLRLSVFCGDSYNSKAFDEAVRLCTEALEMNPSDTQVRYIYARVLMELDRDAEAYEELTAVLEIDPLHEGALQSGGFVAATLDRPEDARRHYNTYLQLNPGAAGVRMTVAYDLAQAGDAEGAMGILADGLELESDNADMRLMHARLAVNAASDAKQGYQATTEAPLPANAMTFYETALSSYGIAYDVQGSEMLASDLRNMVVSNMELGRNDDALSMVNRALETHGTEASLWSTKADLLLRIDDTAGALASLEEVLSIDPAYPNLRARQGRMLLDVDGREEEAVEFLKGAVEAGEQTADAMGRLVFATGHRKGAAGGKNYPFAVKMFTLAKTFDLGDRQLGEVDFWFAYSTYNMAIAQSAVGTLAVAQATLPKFQVALRMFSSPLVGAYADTQPSITMAQFVSGAETYIEIQEAIIARGNR